MNIIKTLIESNIFISLAALLLTMETQIQLGMKSQWHPYLFIIFFATFFEYNFHKLILIYKRKQDLNGFTVLSIVFFIGLLLSFFLAKSEVLIALIPMVLLTLGYSSPVCRLREIPYLKIFLISFVWSIATILLPVFQASIIFNKTHIVIMLIERFFFVFAITIPFDIRDSEFDKKSGLKTLPLLFNENKSLSISYLALIFFFVSSFLHYGPENVHIIWAFAISTLTTMFFLSKNSIRKLKYYHYGVLDGTMLLQGLLVLLCSYLR